MPHFNQVAVLNLARFGQSRVIQHRPIAAAKIADCESPAVKTDHRMCAGDRGVGEDDVVLRALTNLDFITGYLAFGYAAVTQQYVENGFGPLELRVVFWSYHSYLSGGSPGRRVV